MSQSRGEGWHGVASCGGDISGTRIGERRQSGCMVGFVAKSQPTTQCSFTFPLLSTAPFTLTPFVQQVQTRARLHRLHACSPPALKRLACHTSSPQPSPSASLQVKSSPHEPLSQVSAGNGHTCATRTDTRKVECWGRDNYGQSTVSPDVAFLQA